MLHIHWLSPYRLDDIKLVKSVNLASVRLRAGALLSVLPHFSHELTLGDHIPENSSLCIVGKIGVGDVQRRSSSWIDQVRRFRARGGKLILDYTDDHLGVETPMSAFYREAMQHADLCVCSSRLLAGNLAKTYPGRIEVIPDAIEIEPISPKSALHAPVTMLWFGHASNLKYLVEFLPHLKQDRPLRLLILTNIEGIRVLQSTPLQIPPNLQVEGAEWGVTTMLRAALACDLCIIPSDPEDRRKAGVSSNRLLTALALGLPTAAERLDSYMEYESLFTDIRSGQLAALLANPLTFREQVIKAQDGPVRAHEMSRIGQRWLDMLSGL